MTSDQVKVVTTNRQARRNYTVVDTFEAGMVLLGSEVKSLREGKMELKDSYADIRRGEAFLVGAHISPYDFAREGGHDPERERKLLLHRREIRRMIGSVERQGLTLVPLELYFKRGRAKVALALGKGKHAHDKREDIKRRDDEREIARALRSR